MRRLLILLLISIPVWLSAEEIKFPASFLSDTLTKGAKAVVRESIVELQVESPSLAVLKVKYAITILNENGYELSVFNEYYDKFSDIKRLNGKIYNSAGKVVKTIAYSDFRDYSAISGYSLFESTRVKHYNPEYREYPFTVEYSYEKRHSALISIPDWIPYNDYGVSVEKSIFSITSSPLLTVRFFSKNHGSGDVSGEVRGDRRTWMVNNLPALIYEPISPPVGEFLPMVAISPEKFVVDNVSGNANTWNDFGAWIRKLNEGLLTLSPERVEFFKSLASKGTTVKEKIAILYDYLQSNTRYVSIQLGIGGWKPEPASSTDRVGYGDCKALTIYMQSILASAGIKSYYSIIKAGESTGEILSEFPSNQFNHAILCIPLEKDTLWLETTSQKIPDGYLGSFTDNRNALVIFDDEAKLVKTPPLTQNIMNMRSEVLLKGSSADISLKIDYKDLFYDGISVLINAEHQTQKRYIENMFSVPHMLISSFKISDKDRASSAELTAIFSVNGFSTVLSDRIIFQVNPVNVFENPLKTSGNIRYKPIFVQREMQIRDEICFELPDGYYIEYLPDSFTESTIVGELSVSFEKTDKGLNYTKSLKLNKGKLSPDFFTKAQSLFNKAERSDRIKIVAKKIQTDIKTP